jgi:O-methyltransferase
MQSLGYLKTVEVQMSNLIVFGAGSAAKDFLSSVPEEHAIIAIADNDVSKQGSFIDGHEVISLQAIAQRSFDFVVIAGRAVDAIRENLIFNGIPDTKIVAYYPSYSKKLHEVANRDVSLLNTKLGLGIPPVGLATMYLDVEPAVEPVGESPRDFVRDQAFRLAARRVVELNVPGAVAELGVYQGDQAKLINALFPDRPLYLFDTFTGFSENDLSSETSNKFSSASLGDFSNTSVETVLEKMPFRDCVRICQGYFPESAINIEQNFAFVSLDVDLYEPMLAGLFWFYDRLNQGGYIFVHDYNNRRYRGVRKAVEEFAKSRKACCVPLPDFAGSIVITK